MGSGFWGGLLWDASGDYHFHNVNFLHGYVNFTVFLCSVVSLLLTSEVLYISRLLLFRLKSMTVII